MEAADCNDYVFDIVSEYKTSLENPYLSMTCKDYKRSVFQLLYRIHAALLEGNKQKVLKAVLELHNNWLTAVNEIDDFRVELHSITPKYFDECIEFTKQAEVDRFEEFKQYLDHSKLKITEKDLEIIQTEREIIVAMNTAVMSIYESKYNMTKIFKEDSNAVSNAALKDQLICDCLKEVEGLLYALDQIYDSIVLKLSKLYGKQLPDLSYKLSQLLKNVVKTMSPDDSTTVCALMENIKERRDDMRRVLRSGSYHNLEISKVLEKIDQISQRIDRLCDDTSAATMALIHKKNYLEGRLTSLMNLHASLKKIDFGRRVCIAGDGGLFFNHALGRDERTELIQLLCKEWEKTIITQELNFHRKSVISILSAPSPDQYREMYSDSVGDFFVDGHGRKLYLKPGDDRLYQPNESGELVVLQDDPCRIYYYDRCGRYYMDAGLNRIYKAGRDASEYFMDTNGVFYKIFETSDGVDYHYDEFGRFYINSDGNKIYKSTKSASEYTEDGLGNLIRLRVRHVQPLVRDEENQLEGEAQYLRDNVGEALRDCIAKVVLYRPLDPIHMLADTLLKYRKDVDLKERRRREFEDLMKERQLRIREEKDAAALAAALEAAKRRAEFASTYGSEATYDTNLMNYASVKGAGDTNDF